MNQAIVSVLKQPHFEQISTDESVRTKSILTMLTSFKSIPSKGKRVDVTGHRVRIYTELVEISHLSSSQ